MSSYQYLAIALFLFCQCLQSTSILRSNTLKYFFKHRELINFSSNALNYVALSDPAWVEYSYYFKNRKKKEDIKINSKLKIGVFKNSNLPFDCHGTSSNSNGSSSFGGYSKVIFDLLQESLNIQWVYRDKGIWLTFYFGSKIRIFLNSQSLEKNHILIVLKTNCYCFWHNLRHALKIHVWNFEKKSSWKVFKSIQFLHN